jgi:transposase
MTSSQTPGLCPTATAKLGSLAQRRATYDPSMMVALLLYSYARGNRSSRGIERACREDVTYKLITAMRVPGHSTIAEFRRRHERELGELFTKVLLCATRRAWSRWE